VVSKSSNLEAPYAEVLEARLAFFFPQKNRQKVVKFSNLEAPYAEVLEARWLPAWSCWCI
jgi:hypothetical protein